MPLYYQQDINENTRLGVWHILEEEDFFLEKVPLRQEVAHPHKRKQHLAGRFLLPFLFKDFPTELIEIADTRKPFIPGEAFHFSISHCGDYAAAIVSRDTPVGIDIEQITPRVHRIRHKFLHPDELQDWQFRNTPDAHTDPDGFHAQTRLLTLLWSGKEALFKWWGSGTVDFQDHMQIGRPAESPHPGYDSEGVLPAVFQKADKTRRNRYSLTLHYRLETELSLVWLAAAY